GPQARRDRRGHRALRRALTRLSDRRRGVGQGTRPARSQPSLDPPAGASDQREPATSASEPVPASPWEHAAVSATGGGVQSPSSVAASPRPRTTAASARCRRRTPGSARRGSGTGGSQRVQRARRRRVALADQRWPLTAIDEQVIEGDATQERGIDRVNQGEALAELAPSSLCHLEVVALLQLAAGLQNSQAALVPASDVLRLEARRQHEVQPEDMIEPAVLKDRLRWEQLDDPAVHVEVTTDRYRLDEERQRHRY